MCGTPWHVLWSPNTPDDLIEFGEDLIALFESLPTLTFRRLKVLLEFFDGALLVLFAVLQARKHRDEVFDLLLLRDQVSRQFG